MDFSFLSSPSNFLIDLDSIIALQLQPSSKGGSVFFVSPIGFRRKEVQSGRSRGGEQSKRHLEAILRSFSCFMGFVISDAFFHYLPVGKKFTLVFV